MMTHVAYSLLLGVVECKRNSFMPPVSPTFPLSTVSLFFNSFVFIIFLVSLPGWLREKSVIFFFHGQGILQFVGENY